MRNKGTKYSIILLLLILALTGANLLFGSVNIPAEAVWHILTGNEVEKASWSFIVWESRLPQAITALLCGMVLQEREEQHIYLHDKRERLMKLLKF